jgi:WD40 repeat protein
MSDELPTSLPTSPSAWQTEGTTQADSNSAGPTGALLTPPAVPGYQIQEVLGRGGMGVVYRALQVHARRTVALKMILTGAQADAGEIARFRLEAEALARLAHPGIVQVYDVGEVEGKPYFALEFCDGGSLAAYLGAHRLSAQEAAAVVEQLARAVEAAHRRHIVHRDLKPANILLRRKAESTGAGLADFELKIADFGVAKQLDAGREQTLTHALLGTPRYMAPEQASGQARYVGPAADIHALGVILYELLVGMAPYQGDSAYDIMEAVQHVEPTAPRAIDPRIPRDLEVICLKCLRKEPHERYASAADLAEDLRAFSEGRPIQARPVGRLERLVKWARRKPMQAVVCALSLLVLLLGSLTAGAVWLWREAEQNRQTAEFAQGQLTAANTNLEKALGELSLLKELEEHRGYLDRVRMAHKEIQARELERGRALLRECPERWRDWEWYYLDSQARMSQQTFTPSGHAVVTLAMSPDGAFLALVGYQDPLRLLDRRTGKEIRSWPAPDKGMFLGVAFDATGEWLAFSAVAEGKDRKPIAEATLWNRITNETRKLETAPGQVVNDVAFSPDGRWLAGTCDESCLRLWDVRTGKVERELKSQTQLTGLCCGQGSQVLASTLGGLLLAWDLPAFTVTERISPAPLLQGVAVHPTRPLYASLGKSGQLCLWDETTGPTGKTATATAANQKSSRNLVMHPEGKWIAWGVGRSVVLYDPTSGRTSPLEGHTGRVVHLAISANGRWLVSGGEEGAIRVWDTEQLPTYRAGIRQIANGGLITRPTFNADETLIGYLHSQGWFAGMKVFIVDRTGKPIRTWSVNQDRYGPCFSPDLKWLAIIEKKSRIRLLPREPRTPSRDLEPNPEPHALSHLVFSPDGRWIAGCGEDRVSFWSMESGRVEHSIADVPLAKATLLTPQGRLWFQPDGRAFAFYRGDTAELRSFPDGRLLHRFAAVANPEGSMAFSADSQHLATPGSDRTIRIWSTTTGKLEQSLLESSSFVHDVAFHPNGRRLVSGGEGALRIWDLATGKEAFVLERPGEMFFRVEFGPRGHRLSWHAAGKLEFCDAPLPGIALPPEPPFDPAAPAPNPPG